LGKDKKAMKKFAEGLQIAGKHQLLLDSALLNQAIAERLANETERKQRLESAKNLFWICGAMAYYKPELEATTPRKDKEESQPSAAPVKGKADPKLEKKKSDPKMKKGTTKKGKEKDEKQEEVVNSLHTLFSSMVIFISFLLF
jgi:hypothetical protein